MLQTPLIPTLSVFVPLLDGFFTAAPTSGWFRSLWVTEQYSLLWRLYVPGSQQSVSVWGVERIPPRREAPAGSPQLRELGSGSKGIRLSEWVKYVLGLEQVSGMFTSRDGGRKAHVKGTLNKGAARRLQPMPAH